jgi:hypothetical protein
MMRFRLRTLMVFGAIAPLTLTVLYADVVTWLPWLLSVCFEKSSPAQPVQTLTGLCQFRAAR